MLMSFLEGLALGMAVSIVNHLLTLLVLYRSPPGKIKSRLFGVYVLRHALNILTLFLVYKDFYVLIGAGLGLVSVKSYLFIKFLVKGKG